MSRADALEDFLARPKRRRASTAWEEREARAVRRGHPRRMSEAQIQEAVVDHLEAYHAHGVFWFHPANGGLRGKVEAARFKAQGVVAGVPDLVIVKDGRALFLELKTEAGLLSGVQRNAHMALNVAGAPVVTCYGLDHALKQLVVWGAVRGRVSA